MLVDGGVRNSVPADVVREMGADVVVAVTTLGTPKCPAALGDDDESKDRRASRVVKALRRVPVYRVASSSMGLVQSEAAAAHLRCADLIIAPQVEVSYLDFHEAGPVIAIGERAAEAALGEIRQLLDKTSRTKQLGEV